MAHTEDTLAALATPAGTAALAVIRITGPLAPTLAVTIFGILPPPRLATRGAYRDQSGMLVDEVLVTYFAGPRSYTGEDVLEISGHGSPFLAQRILGDLYARGCRPAEPGEFTRRAFLNGRLDLGQAEAVMDLIRARSERAVAAAHHALRGALGREMQLLITGLLTTLATVEAEIDFPEEDLPPADREKLRAAVQTTLAGTRRLLATQRYGELLRDGIKTVIIGAPNAGKSSLLNRLVGRDRALVSPEPGTTRDYLEERIVLGTHGLRLIDTAGLNPNPAPLEKLGMAMTREHLEEADIVLLVLDATQPYPIFFAEESIRLDPDRTVVVLNKSDLPASVSMGIPAGWRGVRVSALTGAGLDELSAAVMAQAERLIPADGPADLAINARHAFALGSAQECLCQALIGLELRGDPALLASDLRGALDALGQIAGKIDHEQVLDRLFAEFCIGK